MPRVKSRLDPESKSSFRRSLSQTPIREPEQCLDSGGSRNKQDALVTGLPLYKKFAFIKRKHFCVSQKFGAGAAFCSACPDQRKVIPRFIEVIRISSLRQLLYS